MYVGGYVGVMNQALEQALSAEKTPIEEEESTPAQTETEEKNSTETEEVAQEIPATLVDAITGATFSSRAVLRAINEGFVFLRDFVLNK